jgi:hypothetical protein
MTEKGCHAALERLFLLFSKIRCAQRAASTGVGGANVDELGRG